MLAAIALQDARGVVVNDYMVWFLIALALGIAELLTGTFYVLMVALGLVAGGLAAWGGAGIALQLLAAATIGLVGVLILRRSRFGRIEEKGDVAHNPNVNLDIGQTVQVDTWREDGTARVWYRGAQWDAQLEPGAPKKQGKHVIKAVRGSSLIVAAAES